MTSKYWVGGKLVNDEATGLRVGETEVPFLLFSPILGVRSISVLPVKTHLTCFQKVSGIRAADI